MAIKNFATLRLCAIQIFSFSITYNYFEFLGVFRRGESDFRLYLLFRSTSQKDIASIPHASCSIMAFLLLQYYLPLQYLSPRGTACLYKPAGKHIYRNNKTYLQNPIGVTCFVILSKNRISLRCSFDSKIKY